MDIKSVRVFGSNIAASLVASIIFLAVSYLFFTTSIGKWLINGRVATPIWLLVFVPPLVGMAVYFLCQIKVNQTSRGRIDSMTRNVILLRSRHKTHDGQGTVCSTRFSHWPLSEESPIRVAFRNELDLAITVEKRHVRRIWNILGPNDAHRLQSMIERYKGCENHSIRVFQNVPVFALPEILIINNQAASLSLPQVHNPSQLDANYVFRDRQSIEVIQGYFELLWDSAIPLFTRGICDLKVMEKVVISSERQRRPT